MNIGGDGNERSSVKLHHPPGGAGSLNIFGGTSEPTYAAPKYEAPSYQAPPVYQDPPIYQAPPTYQAPASYEPSPPSYGYAPEKAPLTDYNYAYEEAKDTPPSYGAPTGFTSSSSYGQPQSIEPSNLNISSGSHTFGQRVESGLNSGPTTEKSSIRVHAPPGGKSSIFF